jgi:hypothetical protein
MDVFAPFSTNPLSFIVQNNAPKVITVFQLKIAPGASVDLMSIPGISEGDIKSSLLKGELRNRLLNHEITILASDLDLISFNAELTTFLQNAGITAGLFAGAQGAKGDPGAQGVAGKNAAAAYIPALPPPNSTTNTLFVDNNGNVSWQQLGGFLITSFILNQPEYVEVGSSISNIAWTANFNFTPTSIVVSCTGLQSQSPAPTGETASGTFIPNTPFTSSTSGTTITVSITAIDPSGAPHTVNSTIVFAANIVWGSALNPVAGQALWNSLASMDSLLATNLDTVIGFASPSGYDQTFAILTSLAPPTLRDPGGDVYTPESLGTANIIENGTTQSFNFYTIGQQGLTFSWSLT